MNLGIRATKVFVATVHLKGITIMDNVRKGEIALAFFKNQLRKEGVHLTPSLRRDIGDTAKTIGIPIEEMMELVEIMVREMVEETFAKKPEKQG